MSELPRGTVTFVFTDIEGSTTLLKRLRRLPHLLAYARGLDGLWRLYQWLDRAPKGRNEGDPPQLWMRRHDEYENTGRPRL